MLNIIGITVIYTLTFDLFNSSPFYLQLLYKETMMKKQWTQFYIRLFIAQQVETLLR